MVHTGMTKRPKPKNKTCCRYKIRDQEKKIEALNQELRRARFAAFNDDPPDED